MIARLFFGCDTSEVKIEGNNIYEYLNGLSDMATAEAKSIPYFLFGEIAASNKLKKTVRTFRSLGRRLIEKRLN